MPIRRAKVLRFIRVGLYQLENEIIEKIQSEQGAEISEIIRAQIRSYGAEHFKPEKDYSKAARIRAELALQESISKKELEDMPPETYATNNLHARVVGNEALFITYSSNPYSIPLSEVKNHTKDSHFIIKMHNEILDGTYKDFNGNLISEEYRQKLIDKLNSTQ